MHKPLVAEWWAARPPGTFFHRSASPGRLQAFDDVLARFAGDGGGDMPVVGAVHLAQVEGQRLVGAAFLDAGSRWVCWGRVVWGMQGFGGGPGSTSGEERGGACDWAGEGEAPTLGGESSAAPLCSPALTSRRQLLACEFHDDDDLNTLEALLVQLGAREVVVLKVGGLVWWGGGSARGGWCSVM